MAHLEGVLHGDDRVAHGDQQHARRPASAGAGVTQLQGDPEPRARYCQAPSHRRRRRHLPHNDVLALSTIL